MSLQDHLSSQVGDRTKEANRKVAARCRDNPALLVEIVDGFKSKDVALLGDCAEVLTLIAEVSPKLVAPYANALSALLAHKTTRVWWEAMHALALIAALVPKTMVSLLPQLSEIVRSDPSVIVRDYAVDAIGKYAQTSSKAARAAYPYLKEALTRWNGKHAARALNGLGNVASTVPELAEELRVLGQQSLDDPRGVVYKAAKRLVKAAQAGENGRGTK